MAILISAPDPDMSAVILEALNADSYKNVAPAYLDVALKSKYSRDADTADMLDLIIDATYFDFAFVNNSSLDWMGSWVFDQLKYGKENITSAWESNRIRFEQKLDDLLNMYKENMGK